MPFILEAIGIVRRELRPDQAVIGFCGGPFTVAGYLIEGKPSREFLNVKRMMYSEPELWHALMEKLTAAFSLYVQGQVRAGADVIQLFDSWVGALSPADYIEFVQPYSARILAAVDAPTIHFGTGTATLLAQMRDAGGDVIGLDWRIPLDWGWEAVGEERGVQGNLDGAILFGPWERVEAATLDVLARAAGRPGHIFNLGHGVMPDTDPAVLGRLRAFVHEQTARVHGMSVAVVLMAYGSPNRIEDVPAYYADIRGGRPIKPEHLEDLVARYQRLGIEESNPLNEITEATRAALEAELGLPVFTGMRHWSPRIAEAVEQALAGGADTIVGLVLAPHYSSLSIEKYRAQLEDALDGRAELRFVERWGDEPGFVALLAERLVVQKHKHVVFTAHSLPARILAEGDPYHDELLATARLVAEAAELEDWSFSFQSESPTGEPWLGPDILDHLDELAANGVEDVVVCPVGFVADHLEIRWDLDVEAAEKAQELGIRFDRISLPNADPAFVEMLAGLVRRAAAVPSAG